MFQKGQLLAFFLPKWRRCSAEFCGCASDILSIAHSDFCASGLFGKEQEPESSVKLTKQEKIRKICLSRTVR